MTIQEMHIAFNLGLQKIASFQVDNLLPQEIDHELNNAMERFIKQRYSTMGNKYRDGFEQSQKRIDDLRNLIVDHRVQTDYQGVATTGFTIDRAKLPNDYMFLVSVMSEMFYTCPTYSPVINESNSYYFSVDITPPSEDIVQFVGMYELDANEDISTAIIEEDLYSSASLLDSSVYNNNYYPNQSQHETGNVQTFHITPTIHGNSLIVYSTASIANGVGIKWSDGTITTTLGTSTLVARKFRVENDSNDPTKREACSYAQHDDLMTLLSDPFNTTKHSGPLYTIQENFVDIYADNTFFSKFVELKYIRRPKRMNKDLSIGCELPEHTHQEIVEMGIKSILEAISDPRYNTQSREVLESE